MLQETKACQDRLEKDMYKLKARIDKAGDTKLLEKLKDHLVCVCANRNNIDHCMNWQEIPPLKMEDGEMVKKPSWTSANLDRGERGRHGSLESCAKSQRTVIEPWKNFLAWN